MSEQIVIALIAGGFGALLPILANFFKSYLDRKHDLKMAEFNRTDQYEIDVRLRNRKIFEEVFIECMELNESALEYAVLVKALIKSPAIDDDLEFKETLNDLHQKFFKLFLKIPFIRAKLVLIKELEIVDRFEKLTLVITSISKIRETKNLETIEDFLKKFPPQIDALVHLMQKRYP